MKNLQTIKITILLFAISMISTIGISQTVTVDGYAYLENQNNHEGVQIIFERLAPSVSFDTAYTDMQGYYTKELNTGIYKIHYTKEGYIPFSTSEEVQLYSNTTLPEITLEIGLGGFISGVLEKGTYKVSSTLIVDEQDSLIIEAGTKLLFTDSTQFIINGYLNANGNKTDTIVFTSYDTSNWLGLRFHYSNSVCKLSHCIVEKSNFSGIRIIHSNTVLSNILVRNNRFYAGGAGTGGGGIYFSNSFSQVDSSNIEYNKCMSGAGIYLFLSNVSFSNSTISNNVNNHEMQNKGGGFYVNSSELSLTNVVISDNKSESNSGAHGIFWGSKLELTNCVIVKNQGCGINTTSCSINNCLISNNTSDGIFSEYEANIEVSNSTISYNKFGISAIPNQPNSTYLLNNNDFYGNPNGNFNNCGDWYGLNVTINNNGDSCDAYNNILLPPQYIDTTNNNFHFLPTSPCIDAGINDSVSMEYDLDGNIRIWDGNNNGTAIVDMGAYKYGAPWYDTTNYYSLSGRVHLDQEYLTDGKVLLFETGESYWLPIHITNISDMGEYTFDSITEGNYVVYAIPNPFELTGYFPTYYVNQLFWWNAYEIDLFGNAFDVDIHLVEIPDGDSGNGNISGVITFESTEVYEEDIYGNDWFGNTTGAPYGAWNMPVFLYDEMSNPIAWALSNESGVFEFVNLPLGQYTLTMEKAGFQLSDSPNIMLDENNPTVSNVNITIKPTDITIDVPTTTFVRNNEFVVYPNPVADELNIKFDTNQKDLTIELFNIAGQKVLSKQINNISQNFKIDVSELGTVVYMGRIKTNTQNHFFKILK